MKTVILILGAFAAFGVALHNLLAHVHAVLANLSAVLP